MGWWERVAGTSAALRAAAVAAARGSAGLLSSPRVRGRALGALTAALAVGLLGRGVTRLEEGEVGVLVNNLTGSLTVEERVGYRLIVPWVEGFHRMDRRVIGLVLAERGGRGSDAVRIKTSDGSSVSIDLQVSYRVLPERADRVLRGAGPGDGFKELWMRSAIRDMAAREFGRLTSEQLYDAGVRDDASQRAVAGLNEQLEEQGLEVLALTPQDFRFYKEYEEIIKAKKLADQEVEEQRSQANLASEESRKLVAAAQFAAQAKLGTAKGEADRLRAEADGYGSRVRLEADGALSTSEGRSKGVLAGGLAEAEGLRESTAALAGPGGVNLVALEYARKLGTIRFTGVPVLDEARVSQYRVSSAAGPVSAAAGAAAGGAR